MVDQLERYDNTVTPGDVNNTPGSYVKRDNDGTVNVGPENVAGPLDAEQGVAFGVKAVSSNTTADSTATYYDVDATAANVAITLPPLASALTGEVYGLTKTDASAHTAGFAPNGTDTINGVNAATTTSTQWGTLKVRTNATKTGWVNC